MPKKILIEVEERDARMLSDVLLNMPLQGNAQNLPGTISRILAIARQIDVQLNEEKHVMEKTEDHEEPVA